MTRTSSFRASESADFFPRVSRKYFFIVIAVASFTCFMESTQSCDIHSCMYMFFARSWLTLAVPPDSVSGKARPPLLQAGLSLASTWYSVEMIVGPACDSRASVNGTACRTSPSHTCHRRLMRNTHNFFYRPRYGRGRRSIALGTKAVWVADYKGLSVSSVYHGLLDPKLEIVPNNFFDL